MQPSPHLRPLRVFALVAGFTAIGAGALAAATAPTTMAPFKVEAEFGVDGLRIQPSSSILNQYLLEQHGVAQLQDISGLAPNLYSSNSDSRGFGDILALRGMANSIFFGAPSVAFVVDDVPSGSVSSYPSALLTVDTLSVKAGPQSTDYGRNAPAGVIDVKTRAPGPQHQGHFLIDRGEFNSTTLQVEADGPLSEQLGYAGTFGFNQRDGYIRNTFRNNPADDRKSYAGRGALYWRPDNTLQLRLGALFESVDDGAPRLSSLFSPDRYAVASDLEGKTQIERLQLSFQLRKKVDLGTVIATTSRQEFDLDPAITDLDFSPLPLASSAVLQNEKLWTQEVRFESTPTADRAQWRAGLFFSDSKSTGDALREFVVPPSAFVPPGFVQSERTVFAIDQQNLAVYANCDQPLTNRTMLKLGVRAERTDSELERTKASSNNFRFPSPQDARVDLSQNHGYGSAMGGLVHTVSDSLSLQGRTSLARKPAGYSGFTGRDALARFGSEKAWANEIGVTFGPPKARFGGSVVGFWNFIDGYQFERTVPGSTDFVVVNAKEVESRGVEAKFMFNPIDRLWWDFQAGYTEATFESHRDSTGVSVKGKRVPFIPQSTLRTGITVDLVKGLSASASYVAIGRTHFDERNTGMFAQKSYGIVNAQLRCRFDRWTATIYGQNLAEEDYYQFINPEIFAGSPGAPRRFGVQLSFAY